MIMLSGGANVLLCFKSEGDGGRFSISSDLGDLGQVAAQSLLTMSCAASGANTHPLCYC
jgi:hypothetical protein